MGPLQGRKEFIDHDGRYVKRFQQLAAMYKIDIVAGSIPEGYNGDLYNTTYYIDSAGTIRGIYRKVNLWSSERSYITPGKEICVFDTNYGKAGLIICWDLMFPEIFRAMVKQGVEIVMCPSYWCLEDAGIRTWATTEIGRAYEDRIYSSLAGQSDVCSCRRNSEPARSRGDSLRFVCPAGRAARLSTPVQVMWICSPSLTRLIVLSSRIGKTSLRPSSMPTRITLMPRVR